MNQLLPALSRPADSVHAEARQLAWIRPVARRRWPAAAADVGNARGCHAADAIPSSALLLERLALDFAQKPQRSRYN